MDRCETIGDLGTDVGGQRAGETATGLQQRPEVTSVGELGDQVGGAVVGPAVGVDAHDVGRVQLGHQRGLLVEPRHELGVPGTAPEEHLDGHRAIEAGVGGPVDDRHLVRRHLLLEPVGPDHAGRIRS